MPLRKDQPQPSGRPKPKVVWKNKPQRGQTQPPLPPVPNRQGEFTQIFGDAGGSAAASPPEQPRHPPAPPEPGGYSFTLQPPGGLPTASPLNRDSGEYVRKLGSSDAIGDRPPAPAVPPPQVTPPPIEPPVAAPPPRPAPVVPGGASDFAQIVAGVQAPVPSAPAPPPPSQPALPSGGGRPTKLLSIGLGILFVLMVVVVLIFALV